MASAVSTLAEVEEGETIDVDELEDNNEHDRERRSPSLEPGEQVEDTEDEDQGHQAKGQGGRGGALLQAEDVSDGDIGGQDDDEDDDEDDLELSEEDEEEVRRRREGYYDYEPRGRRPAAEFAPRRPELQRDLRFHPRIANSRRQRLL